MQVAGEDPTNVAAAQHLRERTLIVKLQHPHRFEQRGRDRRVVHRKHGAVLCRSFQHLGEPGELLCRDLAVVVAGDGGVERDDAQAVNVVDAVLRLLAPLTIKQALGVLQPLIVVSHHPDDGGTHALCDRLDQCSQPCVGVWLTQVCEVAGEHDRIRSHSGVLDLGERLKQMGVRVDTSIEGPPASEKVGVADVRNDVVRCRILSKLGHLISILGGGQPVGGSGACIRSACDELGQINVDEPLQSLCSVSCIVLVYRRELCTERGLDGCGNLSPRGNPCPFNERVKVLLVLAQLGQLPRDTVRCARTMAHVGNVVCAVPFDVDRGSGSCGQLFLQFGDALGPRLRLVAEAFKGGARDAAVVRFVEGGGPGQGADQDPVFHIHASGTPCQHHTLLCGFVDGVKPRCGQPIVVEWRSDGPSSAPSKPHNRDAPYCVVTEREAYVSEGTTPLLRGGQPGLMSTHELTIFAQ